MAAMVILTETNGPLGSSTETQDPINVNLGSVDQAELDPGTNPITAKVDGHSFEKWLRFYVTDMGGSSIVDNFKVWISNTGGGWKTDEGMSTNARTIGYAPASYPGVGPVDTDSVIATDAMPEVEPAGANIGVGGSLSGQITTPPAFSDYLVIQLDVSDTTPVGAVNQKTLTFQWDEQ